LKLPPTRDLYPNLNVDSNGAPDTFNSGLGYTESKPNKPKNTWTRSNRMDVGLLAIANNTIKYTTGKRGVGDILAEDCNREIETASHIHSKVDGKDGKFAYISVGVKDHPCREQ